MRRSNKDVVDLIRHCANALSEQLFKPGKTYKVLFPDGELREVKIPSRQSAKDTSATCGNINDFLSQDSLVLSQQKHPNYSKRTPLLKS